MKFYHVFSHTFSHTCLGTQYVALCLSYPLVMGSTAHLYLPVFSGIRVNTSYQYLNFR